MVRTYEICPQEHLGKSDMPRLYRHDGTHTCLGNRGHTVRREHGYAGDIMQLLRVRRHQWCAVVGVERSAVRGDHRRLAQESAIIAHWHG